MARQLRLFWCYGAAITAIVVAAPGASAQVIQQYFPQVNLDAPVTAADRRNQTDADYDPQGIRVGSFLVQSNVAVAGGYDTNIDAIQGGPSGPSTDFNGVLSARSDWSRNSLFARMSFDTEVYPTSTSRNRTNWTAELGGTLDVGADQLRVVYDHLNLVETNEDIGASTITTKLVPYRVDTGTIRYDAWRLAQISERVEAGVTRYTFSNVVTPSFPQGETFRDRFEVDESATTTWTPAARESLLLVGRSSQIRYSDARLGDFAPDSNGGSLLAGFAYDPEGPLQLRALAGYQVRLYTNAVFGHLYAPVVEASANWTPLRRWTIKLLAQREIEDAGASNLGGFVYTAGRADVSYAIWHNIVLSAHLGVQHAASQPSVFSPTVRILQMPSPQTITNPGVSAQWTISRHLSVIGTYDYDGQSAQGLGDYTRHVALVTFRFDL